ncbi:MAG TPA: phenylalanine--tRNA ligase subunit alpha, partial [Chloroflexota bacterium]|nr:phenylalanine--tRNA ligase subunit alpha [Chloroflexota bacterium]
MADYDPQPALGELNAATTLDALEQWRIKHLGDKSALRVALGGLGKLPSDQRREAGQRLNTARRELTEAYEARQAEVAEKALAE